MPAFGVYALISAMALVAGALLAAQGPILTRLASYAGGPIQAAAVAFAVGLVILLAIGLSNGGLPRAAGLREMPLGLWAAGLIGTGLLLLTLFAVPRIGVAAFTASVVSGQLIAALLYDHFGALGLPERPIQFLDVLASSLLIAGLLLLLTSRGMNS